MLAMPGLTPLPGFECCHSRAAQILLCSVKRLSDMLVPCPAILRTASCAPRRGSGPLVELVVLLEWGGLILLVHRD